MNCFYKKTISNHNNNPKYTLYEKKINTIVQTKIKYL